jgi:hypothetical protein
MMKKQNVIMWASNLVLAALFVCACSTTNQISLTPTTTVTPQTATPVIISTPTSILSQQEALEQIYGKDVNILPGYAESDAYIMFANDITYNIRINIFSCYWDNLGLEKCLVITERSTSYGCHPCGVYIDGGVFDKSLTGWKLHAMQSNMAEIGSFGQIPKGELIQIGYKKYAALLKGTYAQGGSNETLLIIAETKNSFGVVLKINSSSESEYGHENGFGYTAKLTFEMADYNDEYYDIVVKYYGTAQGGKKLPLQLYKLSGTQYVLSYEEK